MLKTHYDVRDRERSSKSHKIIKYTTLGSGIGFIDRSIVVLEVVSRISRTKDSSKAADKEVEHIRTLSLTFNRQAA